MSRTVSPDREDHLITEVEGGASAITGFLDERSDDHQCAEAAPSMPYRCFSCGPMAEASADGGPRPASFFAQ
jgi:hypothetical protein